ncbi:hypothetical protein BDV38DRAFT_278479 [Aspergillus pseudotamarii]|uniref:Tat pathway signal sequence n=1 Tax=Aspergillus pseudotamarii TaxID=132259 RepID=A0A5N6T7G2_ASPPS|nr:uncharacterized protein BDV38DRAFT_278479 [Aspergillus pseudotamarii]KAE8142314.1 hypothetical protein BDV38DRAFT_278479 [Aspergillus pseudotamarii]
MISTQRDGKRNPEEDPFLIQEKHAVTCSHLIAQQRRLYCIILGLLTCLVLITVVAVVAWITSSPLFLRPRHHYSPAEAAVRYKDTIFSASGLQGAPRTKYQGPPTDESEQAWKDLYDVGISKIPFSEAIKLSNKTVPFFEYPGEFYVQIDVFYQLHCLNRIRHWFWHAVSHESSVDNRTHDEPGAAETKRNAIEHVDHCIDSIRQSLMCAADVTALTGFWNEEQQLVKAKLDVIRTCRDFEAIRDWGMEHRALQWNRTVYVPNPLDGYFD